MCKYFVWLRLNGIRFRGRITAKKMMLATKLLSIVNKWADSEEKKGKER